MVSLLLVVFIVEVAVHLVNAIGATTINNLIWLILNRFPLKTSKLAVEQRQLQGEYVKVRRELTATSSQDEFAKWARLRRKHDKLLEQLEKSKKNLDSSRSSFNMYITAVRMLLTRAPQYLLPFWYNKQPMFWLPHAMLPYYLEWFIALPRAPTGSVSIVSWQLGCSITIKMISEAITTIIAMMAQDANVRVKTAVPADAREKPSSSNKAPSRDL